jgi:cytochrome b6-f complex iron-sulfur subunit
MKRSEFIRSLGLSTSALMAVYCMGTLTSCTKEDTPAPTNNNNPTTNPITGKVDFTLDLTQTTNKELTANGGFLYNGDIIIARVRTGGFIALSKVCTHQGTTVVYQKDTNDIYCPNHGSMFDITGKVTKSPAPAPLKMYQTDYNATTMKLRVFES